MTDPEPAITNPAAGGPTSLDYQYCPRCGFPLYQVDRYCGGCDLPLPSGPFRDGPLVARRPGVHDPQKKCWNCPAVAAPDRSYCTACGADLKTTPVVVPKPKKPDRAVRNLVGCLIVLVIQLALLGLVYWTYTKDPSFPNHMFVIVVAFSAAANVIITITQAGLAFGQGSESAGRTPKR